MPKIYILGMGPGHPRYVSPAVLEIASACHILIGGERNLELVTGFPGEKVLVGKDITLLVDYIKENSATKKLGILVSGDPGLFSLLNTLKKYFPREELQVIAGVSSIQYFFASLSLPWHDAVIISLHGRSVPDLAAVVRAHPKVAILTDKRNTPAEICRLLLQEGVEEKIAAIGEKLSYAEEKIHVVPLREARDLAVEELNVLIILDKGLL